MGQVLLESYDYKFEKNWLSQDILRRHSTNKSFKVSAERRRALDEVVYMISSHRYDELTKTVFIQLAFDHFACAIHQPQIACHAVFFQIPADKWVDKYKPFVTHFADKIRAETPSFNGLRGVETLFMDRHFIMDRHMSQGITSVSDLRDEGNVADVQSWEYDHLQEILFAIRTLPGMSVRHGPAMEFLAHQWFCRAVCARQDLFYSEFISQEPTVLAFVLAKEAIQYDEQLAW